MQQELFENSHPILPAKDKTYRAIRHDVTRLKQRENSNLVHHPDERTLMHRYVWEKEKGKIPPGWDIHHINENKGDNRVENLECLPKEEHTRRYSPHNNQYTKGRKRDSYKPI